MSHTKETEATKGKDFQKNHHQATYITTYAECNFKVKIKNQGSLKK